MRIYGPVPSRRFGLSLGVDLVPHKTCSFDCIYCQIGATDRLCSIPEDFYEVDEIIEDVEEAIEDGPMPDVITFAGSGEPTLYRPLGELIDRLKQLADVPILMITNSSMLWRKEVAEAVLKTDILAPSLDAGDEVMYRRINRPHPEVTYDRVLDGLKTVTQSYAGEIRLEVMLIRGINDDEASMKRISQRLEGLRFDQIDINTPVRPPVPERGALPCFDEVLDRALEIFGPRAKAVGTFQPHTEGQTGRAKSFSDLDKDIRGMLLRRPCTVEDIAVSSGLQRNEVLNSLERLTAAGLVDSRSSQGGTYFHIPSANPTILKRDK